jgi:hypothetical protein
MDFLFYLTPYYSHEYISLSSLNFYSQTTPESLSSIVTFHHPLFNEFHPLYKSQSLFPLAQPSHLVPILKDMIYGKWKKEKMKQAQSPYLRRGCKVFGCCGNFVWESSSVFKKHSFGLEDIPANTQQVDSPSEAKD